MMKKLSKDKLREKIEKVSLTQVAGDPNDLFNDKNAFNDILRAKGILKEGNRDTLTRLNAGEL